MNLKAKITVMPEEAWCERHLGKVTVPLSVATMFLLGELLATPEFNIRCGGNPETGQPAKVERADQEAKNVCPICCYLGDRSMERVYARMDPDDAGKPH